MKRKLLAGTMQNMHGTVKNGLPDRSRSAGIHWVRIDMNDFAMSWTYCSWQFFLGLFRPMCCGLPLKDTHIIYTKRDKK